MEIDQRFQVVITYKSTTGLQSDLSLTASQFFDSADIEPEDWSLELPWRYIRLEDYHTPDSEPENFSEIVVNLFDRLTSTSRRIKYQYWDGGMCMVDWLRHSGQPFVCVQVIAELKDPSSGPVQYVKLHMSDGCCRIVSHCMFDSDHNNRHQFYPSDSARGAAGEGSDSDSHGSRGKNQE